MTFSLLVRPGSARGTKTNPASDLRALQLGRIASWNPFLRAKPAGRSQVCGPIDDATNTSGLAVVLLFWKAGQPNSGTRPPGGPPILRTKRAEPRRSPRRYKSVFFLSRDVFPWRDEAAPPHHTPPACHDGSASHPRFRNRSESILVGSKGYVCRRLLRATPERSPGRRYGARAQEEQG